MTEDREPSIGLSFVFILLLITAIIGFGGGAIVGLGITAVKHLFGN